MSENLAPDDVTRVGIYGSCVSRDACEFWDTASPRVYVARQSAIVQLHPMGAHAPSEKKLNSEFQKRAYRGDTRADALERLRGEKLDVILVDLVDERRGVWVSADGEYLTNSIEAFTLGIDRIARTSDLHLLEFGTDEHFELWTRGFRRIMEDLRTLGVPIVLLDLSWAATFDDEKWSSPERRAVGRIFRIARRNLRSSARALSLGRPLWGVVASLFNRVPVEVDERHSDVAKWNEKFRRYVQYATQFVDHVVHRADYEVRSARDHKWGAAPFHYDDDTYISVIRQVESYIGHA